MGLVLLAVVAAVALWFVGAYNRLISLKNQVTNGWTQIDVQLKRRHDLIPNLVNTVKGAMNFERETLEAVVAARNKAIQVGAGGAGVKATGNVAQLQEELTSTENKISFARQHYNDVATEYNTKQRQVPTVFVAGFAGASPAELWEIEDEAERAVPKVEL
jgi:LemA protein